MLRTTTFDNCSEFLEFSFKLLNFTLSARRDVLPQFLQFKHLSLQQLLPFFQLVSQYARTFLYNAVGIAQTINLSILLSQGLSQIRELAVF